MALVKFLEKGKPPAASVYSSVSDISGQYPDTFCYRCSSEFDRQRDAVWHCVECIESFCKKCYPEHFRNKKENWNHTIKDMAGMNPFKQKGLAKQAPVEYLDTSCTHCARDNKAVRAIRFCKDCKSNLCVTCLKWHNDNERFIGHTMKRVWEVQMEKHEKCQKHPDQFITRFCNDHDVVCCIKCLHLDHRNCKFTKEIQKIPEDIERKQNYVFIKQNIKKAYMNTLRLIKARKDDVIRIEDERYNILVEIQTNRERINEHLDRLEKKCKQELKFRYEKFMNEIKQDIQQLEEILSKLAIEANKLQTFKEDNESQQFIYLKQAQQITNASNTIEKKVVRSVGSEYLNFNLNIKVMDTICEMKSLGDFSVFALSLENSFKFSTKKDKHSCDIRDICLMPDGSLVLVDSNNWHIKKLDTSCKLASVCKLDVLAWDCPKAICSTSPTEVAIAMYRTIQFAKVTNTISLTRSFKCDGDCYCIAYNDGELFVVQREYKSNEKVVVVVYNLSGQLLISLDVALNTKDFLFMDAYTGIAVSPRDKLVYIANSDNGLVTMDKTGHKLWEKTELKEICGLTTTENDSLIVCKRNNEKLTFLMIDRDGKTKRKLFQKTFQSGYPQIIMYDTTTSRLFVTFLNSDTIQVYSLTSA